MIYAKLNIIYCTWRKENKNILKICDACKKWIFEKIQNEFDRL